MIHTERRSITLASSNLNVRSTSKGNIVEGYSPRFGSRSEDLGGFVEMFQRGAFTDSLNNRSIDPLVLFGHDSNRVLGRRSSGTATFVQDTTGMFFSAILPQTVDGETVKELMRRGDLFQASFGFAIANPSRDEEWIREQSGDILRVVKRAQYFEASIVAQPAYPDSVVGLRNAPQWVRDGIANPGRGVEDENAEDIDHNYLLEAALRRALLLQ